MNKGLIVLTVAAVLMTGCANKVWVNQSVTNEQAQKDSAECQYDVVKHTPSYNGVSDPIASGITEGMRKNEIMSTCMTSKGYSLQAQQSSQDMTDPQRAVMNRYKLALAKEKIKVDAIGELIVSICRPQDDKGYTECLGGYRKNQIDISVFPEITTKMFREEEEFKQQLLRKEITRQQFKDYSKIAEAPYSKQMDERMSNDVKAGIYTGSNKY